MRRRRPQNRRPACGYYGRCSDGATGDVAASDGAADDAAAKTGETALSVATEQQQASVKSAEQLWHPHGAMIGVGSLCIGSVPLWHLMGKGGNWGPVQKNVPACRRRVDRCRARALDLAGMWHVSARALWCAWECVGVHGFAPHAGVLWAQIRSAS